MSPDQAMPMKGRAIGQTLVGSMLFLMLPTWTVAANGFALLNRLHVGRVKAVDPSRLVIEGIFHDGSFREIPTILEPDAPIINPDLVDRTRKLTRGEIRPGYYVAPERGDSGNRHTARKLTITSTEDEEWLQRASANARRAAPPGLRGTDGGPR